MYIVLNENYRQYAEFETWEALNDAIFRKDIFTGIDFTEFLESFRAGEIRILEGCTEIDFDIGFTVTPLGKRNGKSVASVKTATKKKKISTANLHKKRDNLGRFAKAR